MTTLATAARTVAIAVLRGPFEATAIARVLARLGIGGRVPRPRETFEPEIRKVLARRRRQAAERRRDIAQFLVTSFGTGTRPREADVAESLTLSLAFCAAFEASTLEPIELPPPRMLPATGAPSRWRVPTIVDLGSLARWLRIEPADLQSLRGPRFREPSFVEDARFRHYHHEWIPRRNGPPRLIEAPKQRLAAVQRRILAGLLAKLPAHDAAHGFVRGRSPTTFVAPHVGRRCVLRMDVRDFFASFRRGRVLRLFLTAGYPERVANALADLCTTTTPRAVCTSGLGPSPATAEVEALRDKLLRRHLPQGAPTSPALANLCAFSLDARLTGLATRFGARYTRYADDLVLSGDDTFARDAYRCEVRVGALLLECGLQAAHRKTKVMRAGARQCATGLVMNVHPAIPRDERERLEAILVNCARRGGVAENRNGHADFRAHLRGRIAHMAHVHPALGVRLLGIFARIEW